MVKTHVEVISCLEEQRSGEKLLSFKGESHGPGSCASVIADLKSSCVLQHPAGGRDAMEVFFAAASL